MVDIVETIDKVSAKYLTDEYWANDIARARVIFFSQFHTSIPKESSNKYYKVRLADHGLGRRGH